MITNQILRVKNCPLCGGEVKAEDTTRWLHSTTPLCIPIWQFRRQNKKCCAVMSFDYDRMNNKSDEAFMMCTTRYYPTVN